MNKYTVVLLYPDYIEDGHGKETYIDFFEADTPEEAAALAMREAGEVNGNIPPEDFLPIAVFAGEAELLLAANDF